MSPLRHSTSPPTPPMPAAWRWAVGLGIAASILIAPISWLAFNIEATPLAIGLGGIVFAFSATTLSAFTGTSRVNLIVMASLGVTFIFWGYTLGACIPFLGVSGLPQAFISGAVITRMLDRKQLLGWFVGALVPAWLAAIGWAAVAASLDLPAPIRIGTWQSRSGDLIFPTAVAVWNAIVTIGLAVETRHSRHHKLLHTHPRNNCLYCGYDLRGLPSTTCPECGQAIAARRSEMPQST